MAASYADTPTDAPADEWLLQDSSRVRDHHRSPFGAGHVDQNFYAPGFRAVPMLCIDAQGVDRDAIHADTVRRALQFFRVTLEPKSG
jgi:hypothetical protein